MEAALTPDTLKTIRTQAPIRPAPDIAHDLGWPLSRLRSTAERWRIELINPQPSTNPQPAIDEAKLMSFAAGLPKLQRRIIEELYRHPAGKFLGAELIADRIGSPTSKSVISAIFRLRDKLATTAYDIEAQVGPGGGYRLVTVRTL